MVHDHIPEGDEAAVQLVTSPHDERTTEQEDSLKQIAEAFAGTRVAFSWSLAFEGDSQPSITTDTGWAVEIDRGLDLFQRFDAGPFSVEQALQEARRCRAVSPNYSQAR